MVRPKEIDNRYVQALGLLSAFCVALFIVRMGITGSLRYWFIAENLLLAWSSLLFAWLLLKQLDSKPWLSWSGIALTILWLFFLPNSWYVLTDFLHVQETGEINQLYDIAMMSVLVFCGFTLGFTSLYLIHCELRKRLSTLFSGAAVVIILLLSSFAIYLGRILRWNSWDVVTNPSGVILNVSDRVVNPFGYERAVSITALFFILLGTLYLAIWLFLRPSIYQNRRR